MYVRCCVVSSCSGRVRRVDWYLHFHALNIPKISDWQAEHTDEERRIDDYRAHCSRKSRLTAFLQMTDPYSTAYLTSQDDLHS
jgi:hypothetical protein